MRCLVTGATGFVGGHLCERLGREGHQVLALARAGSDRRILEEAGATIVDGSLDSINVFARHAESIDVVFHLAAVTKALNKKGFYAINAKGTENLAKGLERGGFLGRLVYLSSLAAGGPVADASVPRTEADTDRPVSHYGRSKRAAEEILKRANLSGSLVILRPGAIYGPREHEILEVLRIMARWGFSVKFGKGVQVQMTHVHDIVDALLRAAFQPEAAGKTYYVNDRAIWSFEDIVRFSSEALRRPVRTISLPLSVARGLGSILDAAGKIAGKPLSPLGRDKVREMEAPAWAANPQLIEQELDWRPQHSFPDGLRETIEWYREKSWV